MAAAAPPYSHSPTHTHTQTLGVSRSLSTGSREKLPGIPDWKARTIARSHDGSGDRGPISCNDCATDDPFLPSPNSERLLRLPRRTGTQISRGCVVSRAKRVGAPTVNLCQKGLLSGSLAVIPRPVSSPRWVGRFPLSEPIPTPTPALPHRWLSRSP